MSKNTIETLEARVAWLENFIRHLPGYADMLEGIANAERENAKIAARKEREAECLKATGAKRTKLFRAMVSDERESFLRTLDGATRVTWAKGLDEDGWALLLEHLGPAAPLMAFACAKPEAWIEVRALPGCRGSTPACEMDAETYARLSAMAPEHVAVNAWGTPYFKGIELDRGVSIQMPRAAWDLITSFDPDVALAASGRAEASPIAPALDPLLEVRELEPAKAITMRVQRHRAGSELPARAA